MGNMTDKVKDKFEDAKDMAEDKWDELKDKGEEVKKEADYKATEAKNDAKYGEDNALQFFLLIICEKVVIKRLPPFLWAVLGGLFRWSTDQRPKIYR